MTDAWLYLVNLSLGVIALGFLVLRTSMRRSEMPREVHLLHLLALTLLFGLLVVSSRALVAGLPISVDSLVITAVKVTALVILWRTRTTLYRTGTRHLEGGKANTHRTNEDSDSPNRDIEAKGF